MVEIIELKKKENGSVVGLFERELTEEELTQAKAKFEELQQEYNELEIKMSQIESRIEDFGDVFIEEVFIPTEEESESEDVESLEDENQPETAEDHY